MRGQAGGQQVLNGGIAGIRILQPLSQEYERGTALQRLGDGKGVGNDGGLRGE
jgi:hypothetical protein